MSSILDDSGGFAWRKDSDGRYLFANRMMQENIFAPLTSSDLPGRTDADILSQCSIQHELNGFVESSSIADDLTMACRQKTKLMELWPVQGIDTWVHTVRTPIVKDGSFDGIVGSPHPAWLRAIRSAAWRQVCRSRRALLPPPELTCTRFFGILFQEDGIV